MPDIIMKREHTDRWTKMRLSRARSSGTAASCHMLSSVDCITTTSESEFSVHTTDSAAFQAAAAELASKSALCCGQHCRTGSARGVGDRSVTGDQCGHDGAIDDEPERVRDLHRDRKSV